MKITGKNGFSQVISNVRGGSITISNGVITINGKKVSDLNEIDEKEIHIVIEGDIESLTCDYCEDIEVKGNAKNVKTHNGNVTVNQDVTGNVSTHNGNVMCGKVGGDVDTHNGNIMHS